MLPKSFKILFIEFSVPPLYSYILVFSCSRGGWLISVIINWLKVQTKTLRLKIICFEQKIESENYMKTMVSGSSYTTEGKSYNFLNVRCVFEENK